MRPWIVPALCLGWLLGVLVGSLTAVPLPWINIGLAGATIVYSLFSFRVHWRHSIQGRLVALGLIAALFGVWRASSAQQGDFAVRALWESLYGQEAAVRGIVHDADPRGASMRVTLRDVQAGDRQLPGFVRTTIAPPPHLTMGARLLLRGQLQKPEERFPRTLSKETPAPRGDLERVFQRHGVMAVMRFPDVTLEQVGSPPSWIRVRFALREKLLRSLPEPSAGLYSAFLLSFDGDLARELRDRAAATGILHLVAISGTHVAATTGFALVFCLLVGFSRRVAILAALLLTILYLAIAGFPESGVRSAIMAALVAGAWLVGREAAALRGLIVAAAAMTALNPRLLLGDVGFQLSTLAVWGIIILYPRLEGRFHRVPNPLHLRSLVLLTLAAEVATLPVVAYTFGQVPLVGPLTNLAAGALFPVLLLLGVVVLVAAVLAPALLSLVVPITAATGNLFIGIAELASRLPGHAVVLPPISFATFLGGVALLFIAAQSLSRRRPGLDHGSA